MKICHRLWTKERGWEDASGGEFGSRADLVLVFSAPAIMGDMRLMEEARAMYPGAQFLGVSTAAGILGDSVLEGSLVLTAIIFERSEARLERVKMGGWKSSHAAAAALASSFDHDGLCHVMVFADGSRVNGSELARGMWESLPYGVSVTGALACGGGAPGKGLIFSGGAAEEGEMAAIGFYGGMEVGSASGLGWIPMGVERVITGASGPRLFKLDGRPALDIYREYLGSMASGLPAAASILTLSLRAARTGWEETRAVVAVDEKEGSVTLNGDAPEGARVRLMLGSPERLIEAAMEVSGAAIGAIGSARPDLAIIMNGAGRMMALGQRIEVEMESVRDELLGAPLAGLFSCGEICPARPGPGYALNANSMTVTVFREAAK